MLSWRSFRGAKSCLLWEGPGPCTALPTTESRIDAYRVEPGDTTAAGDTFLGYYLSLALRGARSALECLEMACRAAALCVTRTGAMDSIPRLDEVQAFRPPDSRLAGLKNGDGAGHLR